MKLFQFLEEQIKNNTVLKAFSLKINNANASIDDKTFKSSISNKDFKNVIMTEFLSKKDEDLNKLNDALIELKFQVNDSNYELQFTSKVVGDEISTVLVKLIRNEEDFKDSLKQSIKESGMILKTKTMEDLVEAIFYIVDKYKDETPKEAEEQAVEPEKKEETAPKEEKPEEVKSEEAPKEEKPEEKAEVKNA